MAKCPVCGDLVLSERPHAHALTRKQQEMIESAADREAAGDGGVYGVTTQQGRDAQFGEGPDATLHRTVGVANPPLSPNHAGGNAVPTDRNVRTALAEDHPLMIAWKAYKETDGYADNKSWVTQPKHVDGCLWGAFVAGYYAALDEEKRGAD